MWELSDGTRIELNGSVAGGSRVAQGMRAELAAHFDGSDPIMVFVDPMPASRVRLDLAEPLTIDSWVRQTALRAELTVSRCPEMPAHPDASSPSDPNVVY